MAAVVGYSRAHMRLPLEVSHGCSILGCSIWAALPPVGLFPGSAFPTTVCDSPPHPTCVYHSTSSGAMGFESLILFPEARLSLLSGSQTPHVTGAPCLPLRSEKGVRGGCNRKHRSVLVAWAFVLDNRRGKRWWDRE
eukprot:scaffold22315_cov90-Isochrysis_galbana.AAC.2